MKQLHIETHYNNVGTETSRQSIADVDALVVGVSAQFHALHRGKDVKTVYAGSIDFTMVADPYTILKTFKKNVLLNLSQSCYITKYININHLNFVLRWELF